MVAENNDLRQQLADLAAKNEDLHRTLLSEREAKAIEIQSLRAEIN